MTDNAKMITLTEAADKTKQITAEGITDIWKSGRCN